MKFRHTSLAAALVLAIPVTAHATATTTSTSATIGTIDFDPAVTGRGLCILSGSAAGTLGTGNWACMVTSNPLYSEVTAAVTAAYFRQSSCLFIYDTATAPSAAHSQLLGIICSP